MLTSSSAEAQREATITLEVAAASAVQTNKDAAVDIEGNAQACEPRAKEATVNPMESSTSLRVKLALLATLVVQNVRPSHACGATPIHFAGCAQPGGATVAGIGRVGQRVEWLRLPNYNGRRDPRDA